MRNPLSVRGWLPVVRRQPAGCSDVALTFDDGPTPETTPLLLRLLGDADARATFFLTGARLEAHPELAAALVAAGHHVYAHGWVHQPVSGAAAARGVADLARAERLLAAIRPTPSPYLVRMPYNSGFTDSRVHRALLDFHPQPQFAWWSLSTVDYRIAQEEPDRQRRQAACNAVVAAAEARADLAGAVVLLHECPFDTPAEQAAAVTEMLVPPLLAAIARRGLRAAPMRPADGQGPLARHLLLNRRKPVALWAPVMPVSAGR